MPKKILAIVTCRVSSVEQLESNSLNRQLESVKEAAKYLSATIPSDGMWSGSVSSKSGNNYSRKDLNAMLDYCKKNPSVKYLIVDEIDRFMRSVDEMFYFEVLFREKVGVKVWYAGDPALNSDDPLTKLRRAMEAFKAEGSNLERQIKSIKGQTAALEQGRFPFSPKPGYKRGYERAIQEVHEIRGPALRTVLIRLANKLITPSQAVRELNESDFVKGRALYKMDKFRKIATDPFYAGIVEVNRQVKVRNENGLHKALVSKEQHLKLVQIMNDKKKTQSGPRKNGNPKYPLSNLVNCALCLDKSNGRYVGYDHGNGHSQKVYEKYRCRACQRRITRHDLHTQISQQLERLSISDESLKDITEALNSVWKQKEGEAGQEATRINHQLDSLKDSIRRQVEAATDPSNVDIKDDILSAISSKKEEAANLETQLVGLQTQADNDKEDFLKFAFSFIEDIGSRFLEISHENRLRCKQLVFPAGFYIDAANKVYTPEISPLYRLVGNKKDLSITDKSLLVRVKRL